MLHTINTTDMLTHAEYLKLVQEVNRLRNEVHLFNNEEISESALDDLKHQITTYENTHPDSVSPDSPNSVVSGGVLEGFSKYTHPRRVLSLNDLFSLEEGADWEKKWKDYLFSLWQEDTTKQQVLDIYPTITIDIEQKVTQQKEEFAAQISEQYIAEPKLDGMALILHYQDGVLARAVTRGDSRIGEDVTANVRLISSIPKSIPDTRTIEVRGELIMSLSDFVALNDAIRNNKKKGKMGKTGEEAVFANPRNAVAGTIRNLDQSIITDRPMSFVAYGLFVVA
jgi:DNA ligase (NAD+)